MSDSILKLIPVDPFQTISEQALFDAKLYLETNVRCDFVNINWSPAPMFIDCGDMLEAIFCPNCGSAIDFSWWGEAMNHACETSFSSLMTILPCCKSSASLNDLDYHFPCGFACFVLEIINPVQDIEEQTLASVQRFLGVSLRVIKAHI